METVYDYMYYFLSPSKFISYAVIKFLFFKKLKKISFLKRILLNPDLIKFHVISIKLILLERDEKGGSNCNKSRIIIIITYT